MRYKLDDNINLRYKTGIIKLLVLLLLSVAGVFLIFACTSKYGAGISHDSIAYIYAARSLADGKGFLYFGYETPFVQWPPLFPALLALMLKAGFDCAITGRYINALVFGLIIFFTGRRFLSKVETYSLALMGQAAILLSYPLVFVSKFIWTEPLFILFLTLFIFKLEDYLIENKTKNLALSSVFAALACLTRYIGVTAIITGLLLLFLQSKKFQHKLANMVAFGLVSTVPLMMWFARNYIVFSTTVGSRMPSQYTLGQNLKLTFMTVASWFLPRTWFSGPLKVAALACIILLTIFIVIFALPGGKKYRASDRIPDHGKGSAAYIITPAFFVVVYTIYLVVSAATVAIDVIGTRLLGPVFVPMILMIIFLLDRFYGFLSGQASKPVLKFLLIVFMFSLLIFPLVNVVTLAGNAVDNGAGGYSSKKWKYSETIEYLKNNLSDCNIYSNYPDAIYLHADMPARYTPKKAGPEPYGFGSFEKSVQQSGNTYIVWFDQEISGNLYDPEDLTIHFELEQVVKTADGVVYAIK
jgi:hypothetical protein